MGGAGGILVLDSVREVVEALAGAPVADSSLTACDSGSVSLVQAGRDDIVEDDVQRGVQDSAGEQDLRVSRPPVACETVLDIRPSSTATGFPAHPLEWPQRRESEGHRPVRLALRDGDLGGFGGRGWLGHRHPDLEDAVLVGGRDVGLRGAVRQRQRALEAAVPQFVAREPFSSVLSSTRRCAAICSTLFGPRLREYLVQPMVAAGAELLVGVINEPVFGPLVAVGLGGTATDLVADRVHRLVPLTDADAEEMLVAFRAGALLFDPHRNPPLDRRAVVDTVVRIGRLADALPELAELDVNPLVIGPDGCVVVDARIRVAPAPTTDLMLRLLGC